MSHMVDNHDLSFHIHLIYNTVVSNSDAVGSLHSAKLAASSSKWIIDQGIYSLNNPRDLLRIQRP